MLPGGMVGYVEMALGVWFYLVAADKQKLVKKREREKSKQTYVISFHCNNRSTILCVQTSKGRYESGLYLRSYRTILIFGLTTPNEVKKAYFHIALSAYSSHRYTKNETPCGNSHVSQSASTLVSPYFMITTYRRDCRLEE